VISRFVILVDQRLVTDGRTDRMMTHATTET